MRNEQLGEAGYRAHPYVANSTLSRISSPWLNVAAFRIGTLIHSVILESQNVDYFQRIVKGHAFEYTEAEIKLALNMKLAFMRDPFCRAILAACSVEVEMYNQNTPFDGIALDTRRKYDLWNYSTCEGGDLKSTTARTHEEFLHHVDQFDYDRGRVFYALGSGAKRDVIIGISKHPPHPVFRVVMREGCPLWIRGIEKANRLAKIYHELNPPF
jgi:hypothetical protein